MVNTTNHVLMDAMHFGSAPPLSSTFPCAHDGQSAMTEVANVQ